ncbi:MAG: hypothetical protein JXD22_06215 [Sedimentisphaerales bacterium]|nr:hypothetical protein [Sedimentisphaerales bacterium]
MRKRNRRSGVGDNFRSVRGRDAIRGVRCGSISGIILSVVLTLLFVGILPVLGATRINAQSAEVEFDGAAKVAIQIGVDYRGDDLLEMADTLQGGEPGAPMLPYRMTRVLLPANADLDTVQADLSGAEWEDFSGEYELGSVPPAATWDGEKPVFDWGNGDSSRIVAGRNIDIYGKDAYFPEQVVEIVSIGQYRQWKLVEIKVWQAVYNPVQKKILVLNGGGIKVSTLLQSDAARPMVSGRENGISSEMRSSLLNPEDEEIFYPEGQEAPQEAPQSAADYVIITTSTIQSTSTALSSFVACRGTCGNIVKVVTEGASADDTHYVSGSTADQRANNIRAWLQSHRVSDGIEYVLLIGGPDPSSFSSTTSVPMKMCWPRRGSGSYEDAPSDMFFAELSGNWDLDSDGYYGEYNGDYGSGGADKYCELKVGRIPFYGSYTDLDSILQKTINYCGEIGSRAWREKVLIPAAVSNFGPQDNNGDGDASDGGDFPNSSYRTFGADWGEAIKSSASSASFSPYTLYERTGVYSDGSAYPTTACNAVLTNSNIISEWQNTYGFVTWWGHGSQTSAARLCWTSDATYVGICGNAGAHDETTWYTLFDNSNCSQLDNSHPSFVAQISCLNAYPEVSNNLAYSLLKNGAIGTFAGTRVTWYAVGSWTTGLGGSYGDNASYAYNIFNRMAGSSDTAAAALNHCRSNFGTGFGDSSWMNMVDFNLYGDPGVSRITSSGELPPVAFDDNVNVSTAAPTVIGLSAMDDGKPNPPGVLSYIVTTLPDHGTLEDPGAGLITVPNTTLAGNGNQVIYTSDADYTGPDSFNFKVNDGGTPTDGGDSNIATIYLTVADCQTITIGTGTGTWSFPMYTYYHDSRTQVIYLASELGAAGNITELALDVATLPGQTMNNWTIRMKHTSLNSYSTFSFESTGWTPIYLYQTDEDISSTGWQTFVFSTPFEYNGTDNLMIDFSHNNDSWTSSGTCRCSTPGGYRSIYAYTDSGYGDPLDWDGISLPTAYGSMNVPNVQLTICSASEVPDAPSNLTSIAKTLNSITWSWTDNSADEDGFRGLDENETEKWNVLADVTSHEESPLAANTPYHRQVVAYNATGRSDPNSCAATIWTLAADPNVSCDRQSGNPAWPTGTLFTFTNEAGFGPGGVDNYLYNWSQDENYTFIGNEPNWSSGTKDFTGSNAGKWYLHLLSKNGNDESGGSAAVGCYCILDEPTLLAEPEITSGTCNTIFWDILPDANDYYVECAFDAAFTIPFSNSGWITDTSYEFCGLSSGETYWYRVKAKTADGCESQWSAEEYSQQCALEGDFDSDFDVDLVDLEYFLGHWLEFGCNDAAGDESDWCFGADINQDGQVDLDDYGRLASNWLGMCITGS